MVQIKTSGWWDDLKAKLQGALGMRPTDPVAEKHFKSTKPDWNKFESALDSPKFRQAILKDPRADKKLKQFTAMQGRIQDYDGEAAKVLGSSGTKSYDVQYHKDIKRYTCTCPDFKYKQTFDPAGECKHIKQIKNSGGLKTSMVRAFGAEYAEILDRDADYAWKADSAATRQLRQDREGRLPSDEVEGRLHTTADEPVKETLYSGGSFSDGITKERPWENENLIKECSRLFLTNKKR